MKTEMIVFGNRDDLIRPAQMIADGSVVAFPTETVYGLGANALDERAVARIFDAKGRPADNPLIVHVAEKEDIQPLVQNISFLDECLIDAFMPGPITLVMKKSERIPDSVTAGLPTVGIRIPKNSIARDFIRLARVPLAAPSANESGTPSPTRASHVMRDMDGKIACVIDGGPCEVGLESTVVDVTGTEPVILRPGAVTAEMIEETCEKNGFSFGCIRTQTNASDQETPSAPGMKYRHYAPRVPVRIVHPGSDGHDRVFLREAETFLLMDSKMRVGLFCGESTRMHLENALPENEKKRLVYYVYGPDTDVESAANKLFAGLRSLDLSGVDRILASGFGRGEIATAYMNRLEKAAADDSPLTSHSMNPKERTVLFVCTGNTCRSPMAEAIFNRIVDLNGPYHDADNPSVQVFLKARSAGLATPGGSGANPFAKEAVRRFFNADLSGHVSRRADETVVNSARLILAMEEGIAEGLRRKYPKVSDRIYPFAAYIQSAVGLKIRSEYIQGWDIKDPIGGSLQEYTEMASLFKEMITAAFPSILNDLSARVSDSEKRVSTL